MTPEQTLDWLAQQHFDQCREDRPVQHWIRKMKSELPMKQPLPVQRQPLTSDCTTFVQRFSDAIAIMCGAEPPAEFVDEWLRNVEVDFVARLQEWVLNQEGAPQWAQGIVVLDAAYLLADSPVEGMQHEEATHNIGAKP